MTVLLSALRVVPKFSGFLNISPSDCNASGIKIYVLPPEGSQFTQPQSQVELNPNREEATILKTNRLCSD